MLKIEWKVLRYKVKNLVIFSKLVNLFFVNFYCNRVPLMHAVFCVYFLNCIIRYVSLTWVVSAFCFIVSCNLISQC